MQLRRETQTLLPFLLIFLSIIEIDEHTIIFEIFLHYYCALIRQNRLRFHPI
jgi:hypothetical protein